MDKDITPAGGYGREALSPDAILEQPIEIWRAFLLEREDNVTLRMRIAYLEGMLEELGVK